MLEFAQQLAYLHAKGDQVILVSSGAIAAGRELLGHPHVERGMSAKQMFAAVGQVQLMHIWRELLGIFDIPIGQVLLTRADFSHRKSYLNARDTLFCMLQHGIMPIINENDTVATKEIRVGDNDNLAALVASLVGADRLILLTDQEGLFTADPRLNPEAQLIPVVKNIDEGIFALAKGSSTTLGTGGMTTKIEAAHIAAQSGIPTVVASSARPHVLIDIAQGQQIGTIFLTDITPRESRKRWLLSEKRQGEIHVDDGAAAQISHHGASLLPCGVMHTVQPFGRGDIVHVIDPQSKSIAVGITQYSAAEIDQLLGSHSTGIEDILGYTYGHEVIHRTNMTRIKP